MKKVAIVSGSGGNLGKEVANKLAANGYQVIGTRSPREAASAHENQASTIVDLTVEAETAAYVAELIAAYKAIDVAVLTVGGYAAGDIEATSTTAITGQVRLNFETAYNLARPIFLQMLKQGSGRIFLVGSRPALEPMAGKNMVAYSLAKGLIFQLAELMNAESKGKDVVTTVLVPGTIDTPANRASMPGADTSKWVTTAEIAETILFYCSPTANAISKPVVKFFKNA